MYDDQEIIKRIFRLFSYYELAIFYSQKMSVNEKKNYNREKFH